MAKVSKPFKLLSQNYQHAPGSKVSKLVQDLAEMAQLTAPYGIYAANLTALVCAKTFGQRSKRGLHRAFSRFPNLQCSRSMCRTPGFNPVQARKRFPRTYTHNSASIGLHLALGCPQKMYADSLPTMPLINFTRLHSLRFSVRKLLHGPTSQRSRGSRSGER